MIQRRPISLIFSACATALGRAVIGGLLVATFFTLFFVPVVYKLLKRNFKPRELHPRLRLPSDENHVEASPQLGG